MSLWPVLSQKTYPGVLPIGPVDVPLRARPFNGHEAARFWSKVDVPFRPGACWTWKAGCNGDGYGTFGVGGAALGAHRWAYEHLVGPIPAGLELDHLCRNRKCVRPDHLEAVTHQANVLRSDNPAALASRKTHCPSGHPYKPFVAGGIRYCNPCQRDRYWARKAAS